MTAGGEDAPRFAPVAVLGAGTMGRGIAQVAAMADLETRLFDVDASILEPAREEIRANLDKGIELEKVEPSVKDVALERLEVTEDFGRATEGARTVIEAVPERLELKHRVLYQASLPADPDAVLASNTSSLSISELGSGLPHPDRVVGMHFFNPVHLMELVEVVRGAETSDATVRHARTLAEKMGKTPITVRDAPGFASSRLGVALGLEAIRMVEEDVASPADIDRAMELGYRHPMGPLRLTDLVGLDVRLEIARHLASTLGERFSPPQLLVRMVDEGRLGKKAGRGFYEW